MRFRKIATSWEGPEEPLRQRAAKIPAGGSIAYIVGGDSSSKESSEVTHRKSVPTSFLTRMDIVVWTLILSRPHSTWLQIFHLNTPPVCQTWTLNKAKLSRVGQTLLLISLGAPLSCPTISCCPSALDAPLLPEDHCCCRNNRNSQRKHTLSLDSKNGGAYNTHNGLV